MTATGIQWSMQYNPETPTQSPSTGPISSVFVSPLPSSPSILLMQSRSKFTLGTGMPPSAEIDCSPTTLPPLDRTLD